MSILIAAVCTLAAYMKYFDNKCCIPCKTMVNSNHEII
jgi:hypothetical protein